MAANQFIKFTLLVQSSGLVREGFGLPLILSHLATWSDVVRYYGDTADMVTDGHAIDGPDVLAASAMFAQTPRPAQVAVGKISAPVTMQYQMGAILVQDSFKYAVQVDGQGVTSTNANFTSGVGATAQKIHAGLIAALNAVTGKNYLATYVPLPNFTDIIFTCDHAVPHLIAAGHGLNTGDGPIRLSNSGGALPAGLATATDYYVIKIDANNFLLASSLVNALAGTAVALTGDGTGTSSVQHQAGTLSPFLGYLVTGAAPNNWFSLETLSSLSLSNMMTHADPGVAAALDAIKLADQTGFYTLKTNYNSKAYVNAARAWVEANGKNYIFDVVDTDAVSTNTGNGDTLDVWGLSGDRRSSGHYYSSPVQMFDASLIGAVVPLDPGTWTLFGQTLVGPKPMVLNTTQRNHLLARRAGTYTNEGLPIVWDGKVADLVYGYMDITVGADFFSNDCIVSALSAIVGKKTKTGYTDEDISDVAAKIRGAIQRSIVNTVLDVGDKTDPENLPPDITFPKVKDIDPSIRALRKLPNGTIRGRFTGAVQEIDFSATLIF